MKLPLDILSIRKFLPHRYPFLLVDRITEIHPVFEANGIHATVGTRVVGIKNVTVNEPVFQGHFPHFPIFPGVMLVEAMAQVASFAYYPTYLKENMPDFECILLGVDSARFRKPVMPGDQLVIEATLTRRRGHLWCFSAKISVDAHDVAEAELMANLLPRGSNP